MFFSSKYVYAPKEQKEEYEYVPEGIFNHTAAANDDDPSADDGEVYGYVHVQCVVNLNCRLFPRVSLLHSRHVYWTFWIPLDKRSTHRRETG